MATTNLGGTLPTVNASSDTWGTELNAFMTLVDAQFGPRFSATNVAGGDQTISSATTTKVTLGTELFDVGGYFSSSRFTPLVAGKYRFHGLANVSGTSAMIRGGVYVMKNGTDLYPLQHINGLTGTAASGTFSGTVDLSLNGSTDYVELFALCQATGTITLGGTAPEYCAFSGTFLHT